MDYAYLDLVEASRRWAQRAVGGAWLVEADCRAFAELAEDRQEALLLSADSGQRPLLVAFFGGTGVGKSSLLNRLAGAPIAKAGVERPTSREVTLYHHQAVAADGLPAELLAKTRLAHHQDATQRQTVWLDMPDFDSTEQGNKQLVLQWLPHIDILIYVVSPERYRDNKAWRILQAEGGKHAWLFVFNQWDRGQPEQFQDFQRQLQGAGFSEPVVLRTVCDGEHPEDDFRQLQLTIAALATGQTIEHLRQRGLQFKAGLLQQALRDCLAKFGAADGYRQLCEDWQRRWPDTAALLQQALDWPVQCLAGAYAKTGEDGVKALAQRTSDNGGLWDSYIQGRFEDCLDETVLRAAALQLPPNPIKQALYPLRSQAEKNLLAHSELGLRSALAKPGNSAHRLFLGVVRVAELLLPLLAMGWAGVQVWQGYYQSSLTHSHYLGVDFAVHSVLLIGLSWLAPFFIHKKMQPSLQRVALQGLQKGCQAALARIGAEVSETLRQRAQQRDAWVAEGEALLRQCAALTTTAVPQQTGVLARLLRKDQG